MQTITNIIKAPAHENASDVCKGLGYIITASIVFCLKCIGHIVIAIYKALKWLFTHDARIAKVK